MNIEVLEPVSNGALTAITMQQPYVATIAVEGSASFLFHAWNIEAVEAKATAKKGSKAKKEDDLESYVYRDADGMLAIPGRQFRMAIINAARFQQDPRSTRKTAMDLYKAGVAVLDEFCSLGTRDWDRIDRQRATIQRASITRARPCMLAGWRCIVTLQVLLPEYISPQLLNETVQAAGRLMGVGDYRPTYGRFQVIGFRVE